VPANGSATCSYSASPPDASANSNKAEVTSNTEGVQSATASAPITWKANVKGDETVTLADQRFGYSQDINSTTAFTKSETFTCPTDPAAYTNYLRTDVYKNVATLNGSNTDLSKEAAVTVNCEYPWRDETATGDGTRYPRSDNWFEYTTYYTPGTTPVTKTVDLIAGQNFDAGDITMSPSGTKTSITITLHEGYRWANVPENLKIQPFTKAPTSYVQPGSFKNKFTVNQSNRTVTVEVAKVPYYGIHADVERDVRLAN
jgi:hypothetical protein